MLLELTDPNDPAVRGSLINDDPIGDEIFAGGTMNLFVDEHTSSHGPKELFDLSEPPSFFDRFMVWGRVDENGALLLFLSPTTGDPAHPFATLDEFKAAVQAGGAPTGTGTLSRSNKLPPQVNWQVSP